MTDNQTPEDQAADLDDLETQFIDETGNYFLPP